MITRRQCTLHLIQPFTDELLKHIKIDCQSIHERSSVAWLNPCILKVNYNLQLLSAPVFHRILGKMGLCNIHAHLGRECESKYSMKKKDEVKAGFGCDV